MVAKLLIGSALFAAILVVFCSAGSIGEDKDLLSEGLRKKAQKAMNDGNYQDAFTLFEKLLLTPGDDPERAADDLKMASGCLQNLNRVSELDAFIEKTIGVQGGHWRFLWAAGERYMGIPHYGYIVAGEFRRGQHRGGGMYATSQERDRARAMQLMAEAVEKSEKSRGEQDHYKLSRFHTSFAGVVLQFRGHGASWRLQTLTDLAELPDYVEGYYYGQGAGGAAVDEEGNPVFYQVPDSFEAAKNDGERWRWLLRQALELAPNRKNEIRTQLANFFYNQFGVKTIASGGDFYRNREAGEPEGLYTLHTLGEDETLARLATGVKRFKIPDEYNFIKIYQAIAEGSDTSYREHAWNTLAEIFENRRQYKKAAECWQESIELHGPGHNNYKKDRLAQILDNWCQFEMPRAQPAGQGAVIDFRFRNGEKVRFTAREIDIAALLDDAKDYLKSNPRKLSGDRFDLGRIGYRLIEKKQTKYAGDQVASWTLALKPRKGHFDKRITVTTPLQKPGAYLLTAQMEKGNKSKVVIFVHDTVIVKKQGPNSMLYYVADAVTGEPVAKANVEFFGYRRERVKSTIKGIFRDHDILVRNFARFTDQNGIVELTSKEMDRHYYWVAIARTDPGRLAFLGFSYIWFNPYQYEKYSRTKTFAITDRPAYRPGQTVKFKCWVRQAVYDQKDQSLYANQSHTCTISDPKGEKVLKKTFTTDAFGGFDGEFLLPKDATLGIYRVWTKYGGIHFRVEEYKKPEFEVKVEAPTEPVMLGDEIIATIRAKYYFGAPVTQAKVKYKVMRSSHAGRWYPSAPWDWLYGDGYWWFSPDYSWYPGWYRWGCFRPAPWWMPFSPEQPEVVMEGEMEIGEDGTVRIKIDTTFAKEVHGDQDHRYEITVEVTDESRRTIVGQGRVLAARKPFKVYAWVDRGYYRVGDTIGASFSAQTLDQKPVPGKGKLHLLKVAYGKDGRPEETSVQQWDLDTDVDGRARVQIKASAPGQYRLSFEVTDGKGHTEEGGYVFFVRGEGFDGSEYRFNNLELITDKREYAPGEKVRLMISTNRPDSTVLLFVRAAGGIYPKPEVLRMKGKSRIVEIEVVTGDMPNFLVEALTVSDGNVHTEVKEIIVPPESRVLSVDVLPNAETYKPGEEATLRIRIKDFFGKPYQGSAVITVYDKSLEYIAGGPNVPEIKAYFWKWRRRHTPRTDTNLTGPGYYQRVFTSPQMRYLGAFGDLVADSSIDCDALEEKEESLDRGAVMNNRSKMEGVDFLKGRAGPRGPGGPATVGGAQARRAFQDEESAGEDLGWGAGGPEPEAVQPMIRKKFADTAFFAASVATDADGFAEVSFPMPDNLTAWKVKTWAMGRGTRVGEGETEVVTSKNLLLRLQAPRFFVEKDEVVLSANIHNYLDEEKTVQAVLELDGGTLEPIDGGERNITLASMSEQRVDWRVKVVREGEAVIRMKALSDEESDAMEMRFPVFVHGVEKTVSFSAAIRPKGDVARIILNVPAERRINESLLEIRYSPTLAGAMVDALPYLAEYPYGCTEQTLNRFLPAVITKKVLMDMGLDLKAIQEKQVNLNAQEIGDPKARAARWKVWKRNPVFDEETLMEMVRAGLERLYAMQLSDGGWGWFSGYREHSSAHTTAVVVHGLQVAVACDLALVPGVLDRGIAWLERCQEKETQKLRNYPGKKKPYKSQASNLDAFVYAVLSDAGKVTEEMRDYLYRDRTKISVYAKALFGLALHAQGRVDKLDMILKNIEQFLVRDEENQTAHLNLGGYWWCWYGSEYEAHAAYLKLLSKVDPKGETASWLSKYLVNNRSHGTYWKSTRDTALCIEALAAFIDASGESAPDMTVEILLDGQKLKEVRITKENLFAFDGTVQVRGDAVESGEHTVEIRKKGKGPLYINAYLTYFSLEDFIEKAGLEVKVNRKVYRLVPVDKEIDAAGSRGQAVRQKVEKYKREALDNLATLKSGDLVEVELIIESKNDYEYVVFEDMKAAGFEAVEVRSGYLRRGFRAYMELRDERVAFFVERLARGKHSVSYRLRAEIPGVFSALPARAFGMYAPELRGNSDEIKLKIVD